MSEYDTPWKEALEVFFQSFIALFFPAAHSDIDWSRKPEFLDTELQQILPGGQHGRRIVDKLVRVWTRSGREEWILIHIEVQSGWEADFALRIYAYHSRLFASYNRTIVTIVVLGDENPNWRPDQYGYDQWGCQLQYRYPVLKLLDWADRVDELETSDNPFATLVLAHLKALETRQNPEGRRTWKRRLMRGLLDRAIDREQIRQLFRFMEWMLDLPTDMDAELKQELHDYAKEKHVPFMTNWERGWFEDGKQAAMQAAMQAATQEVDRRSALRAIRLGLKLRFGPSGSELLPIVEAVHDQAVLEALIEAIERGASLEEISGLLPSSTP